MKYCGKCGAENPDTDLFCWKCGNRLHDEPAVEPKVEGEPPRVDVEAEVVHEADTSHTGTNGGASYEAPRNANYVPYGANGSAHASYSGGMSQKDKMRYAMLGIWVITFALTLYVLFFMNIDFETKNGFLSDSNTIYGMDRDGWSEMMTMVALLIIAELVFLVLPLFGVMLPFLLAVLAVVFSISTFNIPVIGHSMTVEMTADSSAVAVLIVITIIVAILVGIQYYLLPRYLGMTGKTVLNGTDFIFPYRL